MNKPETFAARMQQLLDVKQITKAELARRTGISRSSITRYVKGDWEGKQDAVYKIALEMDVSEAWLMGYDVPMQRIVAPEAPDVDSYNVPKGPVTAAFYDYLAEWIKTAETTGRGLLELFYTLGDPISKIRDGFLEKNPDAKHVLAKNMGDNSLAALILKLESRNPKDRVLWPSDFETQKRIRERNKNIDFELYVLIEKAMRLSPENRNKLSKVADDLLKSQN